MNTKVTLHQEAQAAEAAPAPNGFYYVTDTKGRRIGLRRLDFIEEFRIVETLGKLAENKVYMQMVNPLLLVAEIDGDVVPPPRSKLQVDALIQRVGGDGYIAVLEGMVKYFAQDNSDIEERIKNAAGTPDSETVSGS